MAAYSFPIDIANRACDHCGVPQIVAFTDDAKAAFYTNANYDKQRDAELRRNVWRFSIRKVALRAVDTNTMFLVPAAWSGSKIYPQSSIVSYNSVFYISGQYVAAGITPGTPNEAYWTVYFGPKTATPGTRHLRPARVRRSPSGLRPSPTMTAPMSSALTTWSMSARSAPASTTIRLATMAFIGSPPARQPRASRSPATMPGSWSTTSSAMS